MSFAASQARDATVSIVEDAGINFVQIRFAAIRAYKRLVSLDDGFLVDAVSKGTETGRQIIDSLH